MGNRALEFMIGKDMPESKSIAHRWALEMIGGEATAVCSFGSVCDMCEALIAEAHDQVIMGHPNFNPGCLVRWEDQENCGRRFTSWIDPFVKAMGVWDYGMKTYAEPCLNAMANREIHVESVMRQQQWSNDGDEVDWDRMRWSGREDYFRRVHRTKGIKSTAVTLVVEQSFSRTLDPSTICWQAAAVVTAGQLLEKAGYNVEVLSMICSQVVMDTRQHDQTFPIEGVFPNGLINSLVTTCVKRAEEPWCLPTVFNALSGWFYRTAVLSAESLNPYAPTDDIIGYVRSARKAEIKHVSPARLGAMVRSGAHWSFDEAMQCVEAIIETIEAANHK